jgi:hypothetical protein
VFEYAERLVDPVPVSTDETTEPSRIYRESHAINSSMKIALSFPQ